MFSSVSLPPALSENGGIAMPGLIDGAFATHLFSHVFGSCGSVLAVPLVNEWHVVQACCGLFCTSCFPPSGPVGSFGGAGVCGLGGRPASSRTWMTSFHS